jgi:hypothetical protein
MNITVLSVVHGDWFDRFGLGFIETLEAASCENAVLVSDRKVSVPSFVKLIVKDFENHADFCNTANAALETDWGLWLGFDDLLLPDALESIESNADIYGWPHQMSGIRSGLSSYLGDYENTWRLGHNPMAGGFAYRKELLEEIPFRDFIYLDWIHFCETSFFGKSFEASPTPRTVWVRRDDSLSITGNAEAHGEVYDFQFRLVGGAIQKGVPE